MKHGYCTVIKKCFTLNIVLIIELYDTLKRGDLVVYLERMFGIKIYLDLSVNVVA